MQGPTDEGLVAFAEEEAEANARLSLYLAVANDYLERL